MSGLSATYTTLYAFAVLLMLPCTMVFADSNEYLKYQEPKTQSSLFSSIDTILYTITMFLLILGLAYITSRFVGQKMAARTSSHGDGVINSLALGPNRGLYLVDFAGRLLLLGVTDHSVELLADMTDDPNASELKATYRTGIQPVTAPQFSQVFDSQLAALRQMSEKFPRVFGQYGDSSPETEREQEKR